MNKEAKGRIHWKNTETGNTGHGSRVLDFSEAKDWMDDGDRRFPLLRHWFVPV